MKLTSAWEALLGVAVLITAMLAKLAVPGSALALSASAAVLMALVMVVLIAVLFWVEDVFGKDVEG